MNDYTADDGSQQQAMLQEEEQMTQPQNIHQRMHAVMKSIAYVQKGDKTVNGQYRFVTHDAVTAKVRGALIEHGILSLVTVERHTQDGNRTEADVRVEFVNVDDPTDRVTIHSFGYGIDPQDKGPGKAVSYAVKYAYLKAFALETGDDPEKDSIDHAPAGEPTSQEINDALMLLAEEAADGFGAVQKTMDALRPPVREYLRKHKKTELASIKTAATKNAEPAHASH